MVATDNKAINEFVENVIYRLDENTRMISIAFDTLTEEQLWLRSNKASNSVGNLILHLCGNMTQYAISSLGETEDVRDRDSEFETSSGLTKKELLSKLLNTVSDAKSTIENATIGQWLKKRDVQGFHFSGIGVILHVVEHYSYHTGQIAFWAKQLNNKALGFYDGIDLNIKNEE
ncbi:DinB family protein [Croceitalea rosinachiae]|uniref:DinB family protein n=1 Tax=Croceitalea rosinachiae TaxID=3075596 RepID=A0ABU3AC02_9FLAO|nr:DinB family protein [Croceitalea sp. F388]MDT0607499.1 DinB family protein [Croceitalea sp. F388]